MRDLAGQRALAQRLQVHKARNVCGHLPEHQRAWVQAKLRKAWSEPDHSKALTSLTALASQLEKTHPDAAGSLREGMEETLTLTRLGIDGALARTLRQTNNIESMSGTVRTTQRNVKRWRDGDMRLRWTAAGMREAAAHFNRVKGHRDLPKLQAAIQRELHPTIPTAQADTPKPPDLLPLLTGGQRRSETLIGLSLPAPPTQRLEPTDPAQQRPG